MIARAALGACRQEPVVVENATHQFDLFGSPAMRSLLAGFLRDGIVATPQITLPPIVFAR